MMLAIKRLGSSLGALRSSIFTEEGRRWPGAIFAHVVTSLLLKHPFLTPGQRRAKNSGGSMKKLIGKLMVMCVLALSLNAVAQSTTDTSQDGMKHDDMKQDTMKHDDMKKDEMAKDKKAKKHKKDKMKADDMKKDDMKKDDMKKDSMGNDEMKKN
jgi:pentapeptide MXKDX repeat protein